MTAISHVNAGNRLSASKLNTIIDQVNALTAPGWTDFSASLALTAVTTNPTKGNSVYVAQYRYVTGADVCDFEFEITIGSGFAAGSGTYRINLPVACAGGTTLIGYMGGNESGVALRGGSYQYVDSTHVELWPAGSTTPSGSTGYFSGGGWTTNDSFKGVLRYRV